MSITVREQVSLKEYTTLRVGGAARYFIEVSSVVEIDEAVQFAKQTELPHLIIGGGSNLLISDEGFSGVVIYVQLKGIEYFEISNDEVLLIAQAGENFDEVISDSVEKKYSGLENLSAIPGTVGATPVQNVGAYGVEVADLIEVVETYHISTGEIKKFSSEMCDFKYRDSFFKTKEGREYVITSVHFCLRKNIFSPKINYADLKKIFGENIPTLTEVREAVINIRSKKFPDWHKVGTAGSFFKNPVINTDVAESLQVCFPELPIYKMNDNQAKVSLGYILDKVCNLKGYRDNKVGLFINQALVLVNYDGANSKEIADFAKQIKEKVFEMTKIKIEPEVRYIENNN